MPDIEMMEVESSQIHSIGHCGQSNTLAIRFRKKGKCVRDKRTGGQNEFC